jgi:hypothetical protein
MKQIRRNVFETNSSSTHSITFVNKDELFSFINGESFFNSYYHHGKNNDDNLPEFPTREQVKNFILDKVLKYNKLVNASQADAKELEQVAWDLKWLSAAASTDVREATCSSRHEMRTDGTWFVRQGYQKIDDVDYWVNTVVDSLGYDGQFISFSGANFVHISKGGISYDDDGLSDEVHEEITNCAKERNIKNKPFGLLLQYYEG